MLLRTIAFLTGIITLSFQSQLPPVGIILSLVLLTPLLLLKKQLIVLFFWYCCGFIWATVIAHQFLNTKLPTQLEGQDIVVTGVISSIPKQNSRRTNFEFTLSSVSLNGKDYDSPKKIILNWYGKTPKLIPDDKWQLVVRLKKPFSVQNPGGFDYEAWIFQNNIDAKGYIRKNNLNKLLQSSASLFSFTRLRFKLKHEISLLTKSPNRAVILALLIGDKSEITAEQWQVFRKTGTSHLIAISGLHIGLIAGLVFFLSRWLWGYYSSGAEILPSPKFAALLAIISALLYSAMAGFSLPTQRALIMLCVIMVSILIDVRAQSWNTLAIALLLVLLFSPFAVMNPGFWLSFSAVGIILYFSKMTQNRINKLYSVLYNWSVIQLVIGIGLMPLVLLFFNETSLISPVANMFIVPLFSFIIVPMVFLAGCLLLILPFISSVLLSIVAFILTISWGFLEYLAELSFATFQINGLTIPAFIFLCMGIGVLLLPRPIPAKWLSVIFFLPLFFTKYDKPELGSVKLTLLDVGQGLSVVIQTHDHVLVYDTGPGYSKNFNAGKNIVIPFLKSNGINTLDMIVVSHGDNDHIGGMRSLVDTLLVKQILTSVPKKVNSLIKLENTILSAQYCDNEKQWNWDGVNFQFIHPQSGSMFTKNNASCVLLISTGGEDYFNSVLLTGDIEAKAEQDIVEKSTVEIRANIIIAPHHGSKTSSSQAFINKINPDYVLYAVGYQNRYRFPHDVVSNRYKQLGAIELTTSGSGAITFNISPSEIKKPELYRVSQRRFWHN